MQVLERELVQRERTPLDWREQEIALRVKAVSYNVAFTEREANKLIFLGHYTKDDGLSEDRQVSVESGVTTIEDVRRKINEEDTLSEGGQLIAKLDGVASDNCATLTRKQKAKILFASYLHETGKLNDGNAQVSKQTAPAAQKGK